MFGLSPTLALWSFAGVLLALLATSAFRRPVEARTRRVREAMADLSHFLAERLAALRAIRFHRAEREEQRRLAAANERLNREVVGFQVLDSMSTGVPGLLLTLALAWIYVAGGSLLEAGTISLGTFVAFVLYQGRLFGPAQGLLGLVRSLQEARVSLARVAEVLGPDDRHGEPRTGAPTAVIDERGIVLQDVTFAYAGKPPVLRGVDLRIAPGERVALFGASGAGKSTLVQLIFGLREPGIGSVRIDGRSACERGRGGDRDVLGYAGAEPFLLHASVEENLRYGNPAATREDLARALALGRGRTPSSPRSPTAATPSSAAAGSRFPTASASVWVSRACSCAIRRSWCSTRRSPASTWTPRPASGPICGRRSPIAPRSSSRIGRWASTNSTGSCSCTTGASPRSPRTS